MNRSDVARGQVEDKRGITKVKIKSAPVQSCDGLAAIFVSSLPQVPCPLVVHSHHGSIYYHARDVLFLATSTARRTWERARGRVARWSFARRVLRGPIQVLARRPSWPRQRSAISGSSSVPGRASETSEGCNKDDEKEEEEEEEEEEEGEEEEKAAEATGAPEPQQLLGPAPFVIIGELQGPCRFRRRRKKSNFLFYARSKTSLIFNASIDSCFSKLEVLLRIFGEFDINDIEDTRCGKQDSPLIGSPSIECLVALLFLTCCGGTLGILAAGVPGLGKN
ncbi:hypothetical protein V1477_007652 [Vespula maculifrons]|uniref:Uncharacterized protein n=1 Tax=Vespula maculifrons TaxID=7453 RepID=A0ABD2CGF0_VESMC